MAILDSEGYSRCNHAFRCRFCHLERFMVRSCCSSRNQSSVPPNVSSRFAKVSLWLWYLAYVPQQQGSISASLSPQNSNSWEKVIHVWESGSMHFIAQWSSISAYVVSPQGFANDLHACLWKELYAITSAETNSVIPLIRFPFVRLHTSTFSMNLRKHCFRVMATQWHKSLGYPSPKELEFLQHVIQASSFISFLDL